MIKEIIIKEIRDYILSTRFIVAFILSALLLLVSIYLGMNSYLKEVQEYNASQFLENEQRNIYPDYMQLQMGDIHFFKPPQVLSIFAEGVQDAVGNTAKFKLNSAPQLLEAKYSSKPLLSVFGYFDLVMITKYFLSLFVILFTYNAISGEKENGTLKAIVSNQLPRYKILVGKSIGSFISLIIPLTLPLLFAFILLTFDPRLSLSGEDWIRSSLILMSIVLYISIFCSLGLFVSSMTRNSSLSLFILMLIWIGFVFIIPQGAVILSDTISTTKSVFELNADKRDIIRVKSESVVEEIDVWQQENKKHSNEEFLDYYHDILQKSSQEKNKEIEAIDYQHMSHIRKQQEITRLIARFSPASIFHFCVMSLAGTGIEDQENFNRYLSEYKEGYDRWIIEHLKDELMFIPGKEKAKPDFSSMPKFEYKRESLKDSLSRAIPDLASMVFMMLFLVLGSIHLINKYDVR